MKPRAWLVVLMGVWAMVVLVGRAVEIQFEYSRDDAGFFEDPARRAALDRAAAEFEPWILDALPAILPAGENHWTNYFRNPSTGEVDQEVDLVVPRDTLVVYVGARTFENPSALAVGGYGGFEVDGATNWQELVAFRGQDANGATLEPETSTDYGGWGGAISFNPSADWHFGEDTPPSGSIDFHTVVVHELGHVLGIGTVESWDHWVNTNSHTFGGPVSTAVAGENPSLFPKDDSHWDESARSWKPGENTLVRPVMTPSLGYGERRGLTELDWGGLADVGWEVDPSRLGVVPEPGSGRLALAGVLLAGGVFRRWRGEGGKSGEGG